MGVTRDVKNGERRFIRIPLVPWIGRVYSKTQGSPTEHQNFPFNNPPLLNNENISRKTLHYYRSYASQADPDSFFCKASFLMFC